MDAERNIRFHFDNVYNSEPVDYGSVNLVQIGDLSCAGGYFQEDHKQWCYEISYIVSGQGRFGGCSRVIDVKKGDIFINAIEDVHSVYSDVYDPLRFFYLGFTFNEYRPESREFRVVRHFFDTCTMPRTKDRYNLYTAFISAFNEFVAGLPLRHILIRSHLEQIIIMTYRNFATNQTSRYMQRDTNRTENLVYSTINYIDNNILNIKNLQEVGEALGYSYSYLSQLFSKSVGKPLKDYFFSKRFELAAELLEKYNVTTVAQQLGYDTVYSFSRAFKRHFGVAPSGYKKKKDPKQEGNP
ncbi:MAG TPA: AraC family transcriptional regulator [Firmicutes bacterium]|nr:AraC family transcriptional regulator [Bacillota bacterium]